jgi:hypothetical protein
VNADVRIQGAAVETAHRSGVFGIDVSVAEVLADDGSFLYSTKPSSPQ